MYDCFVNTENGEGFYADLDMIPMIMELERKGYKVLNCTHDCNCSAFNVPDEHGNMTSYYLIHDLDDRPICFLIEMPKEEYAKAIIEKLSKGSSYYIPEYDENAPDVSPSMSKLFNIKHIVENDNGIACEYKFDPDGEENFNALLNALHNAFAGDGNYINSSIILSNSEALARFTGLPDPKTYKINLLVFRDCSMPISEIDSRVMAAADSVGYETFDPETSGQSNTEKPESKRATTIKALRSEIHDLKEINADLKADLINLRKYVDNIIAKYSD